MKTMVEFGGSVSEMHKYGFGGENKSVYTNLRKDRLFCTHGNK